WIGVATQPVVKNMAEKLGHADARGFRIMRVYGGTNAAKAGMRVGDIIYSIDGSKMVPDGLKDAGKLNREVRRMSIDQSVVLGVWRDGASVDVKLDLERTRQTAEEVPRVRNTD